MWACPVGGRATLSDLKRSAAATTDGDNQDKQTESNLCSVDFSAQFVCRSLSYFFLSLHFELNPHFKLWGPEVQMPEHKDMMKRKHTADMRDVPDTF